MKAVSGELPDTDGWAYEIKWDGMRIMAYLNDEGVPLRLETTRGHDAADRFPELSSLPASLGPVPAILDGEVVAFEGERPSFGRLQHRMHLTEERVVARAAENNPVCYVIFDICHLDGHDVTHLTYLQRRDLLTRFVDHDGEAWRVPAHHLEDGASLLAAARASGLEGVVAKRSDSVYLPGRRSPNWVKAKVRNEQEVVVGGWQPGAGHRTGKIGSLLVGYYDADHRFRYAGRVGTGFSDAELDRLGDLFAERATSEPPFDPPPPASVRRTARWVRPELVAQIVFGEWTSEGILRHASYLGLREDKEPTDVVRET